MTLGESDEHDNGRRSQELSRISACGTKVWIEESGAEAFRQYDLASSEIEEWIEHCKADMENALCGKLENAVSNTNEIKTFQEAYGASVSELRARKCGPCCTRREVAPVVWTVPRGF
jgi:hypothetical protein